MALKTWSDTTERFTGAVLELREENGYHDSDFYALVWDDETQTVRRVEYHTTRGASNGWAKADATDEVKAKADEWHASVSFDYLRRLDERDAREFAAGKTAAVTRTYRSRKLGRTLEKGETGKVFFYGRGFGQPYAEKYGRKPPMRVGLEFADGRLFFSDDDVEVVEWEQYLTDEATLVERARQMSKGRSLAWYFTSMGVVF